MKKKRIFHVLVSALAFMLLLLGTAQAENCESIRFKRGESSGIVQGTAPPDDVVCYQMTTGDGQTASLAISGRNCIFSIDGVVDAQDRYSFTTKKKTYKIAVGQLMRSVSAEPFSLSVSIR